MKNTLYLECLSGISGDMTIGALLDLGPDVNKFKDELKKINLQGYELKIQKKDKNGIFGTKFDVILTTDLRAGHHHHDHDHHDHDHHDHDHHHDDHRCLTTIKGLIEEASLSDQVKKMSISMFQAIAEAEAKIHNTSLDQVHFHEVGAVDAIVDIVGTCILIEMLEIDEVIISPLHVGTGFVKCAHGKIPVPAPATLEILKGIPIYSKGIRSELVTPTGAAIAKVLGKSFEERPLMETLSIGYGLGTKDLEISNVLRASLIKKKQ